MVVPLIFGKMAKDLLDSFGEETAGAAASPDFLLLAAGFIAAFVTGWLACVWMIRLVKACQLTYFAVYCFVVGLIAIASALWF